MVSRHSVISPRLAIFIIVSFRMSNVCVTYKLYVRATQIVFILSFLFYNILKFKALMPSPFCCCCCHMPAYGYV